MDHSCNEEKSEWLDHYGIMIERILYKRVPTISTMAYIYNLMMLIIDVYYLIIQSIKTSTDSPEYYREYLYHRVPDNKAYGIYEIYKNGLARGELNIYKVYFYIIQLNDVNEATIEYKPTFVAESYSFADSTKKCIFKDGSMLREELPVYKILFALNLNNKQDAVVVDTLQLVIDLINLNLGISNRKVEALTMKWEVDDNNDFATEMKELINDEAVLFVVGTLTYNLLFLVIQKEIQLIQY